MVPVQMHLSRVRSLGLGAVIIGPRVRYSERSIHDTVSANNGRWSWFHQAVRSKLTGGGGGRCEVGNTSEGSAAVRFFPMRRDAHGSGFIGGGIFGPRIKSERIRARWIESGGFDLPFVTANARLRSSGLSPLAIRAGRLSGNTRG